MTLNAGIIGLVLASMAALLAMSLGCSTTTRQPGNQQLAVTNTDTSSTTSGGEMLLVGTRAPDFQLPDDQGNTIHLADYLGKQNIILVFYPGNNTPVCTAQLCTIRDEWSEFASADVAVFGVNPAAVASHRSFRDKHDFPFPLLADREGDVIRAYGCEGLLGLTKRTVYGIDKDGTIVFARRGRPDTASILQAFPSSDHAAN